jgi:hypothetical protein
MGVCAGTAAGAGEGDGASDRAGVVLVAAFSPGVVHAVWASFGMAREGIGFRVAFAISAGLTIGFALAIGFVLAIGVAIAIGAAVAIRVALDAGAVPDACVDPGVSVAVRFVATPDAGPGTGAAPEEDVAECEAGFDAALAFGAGTGAPAGADAGLGT